MSYVTKAVQDIKRFRIERQFQSKNRDPNCWLFGEWFGKRCNDNSLSLANYIAVHHPEISLFWSACEETDVSLLHKFIHIIRYDSKEAMDIFKRAGVVIMNQGYIDFSSSGFNYFRGAITLNLWHGVAWKKIGHDKTKIGGLIHNLHVKIFDHFEKTEQYVSLSRRYTEVLHTAFHAKDNEIINAGYPRNVYFYSPKWLSANRIELLDALREKESPGKDYAWLTDQTKIVLYMPTFRDTQSRMQSLECLAEDPAFMEWMEEDNIVIVQKAHFVSQQRNELQTNRAARRILTRNDLVPYKALGAADVLITDYSSCFFDYLVLNRPIIHYIYDYDHYKTEDRGVYYEKEDVVCGTAVQDIEKLKRALISYIKSPDIDSDLRRRRKTQYIEYESEDSCRIIFDTINRIARKRFRQY